MEVAGFEEFNALDERSTYTVGVHCRVGGYGWGRGGTSVEVQAGVEPVSVLEVWGEGCGWVVGEVATIVE